MSRLLYRWGRWSATRPWIAIGAWVLLSVLVVAASAVGRSGASSFRSVPDVSAVPRLGV